MPVSAAATTTAATGTGPAPHAGLLLPASPWLPPAPLTLVDVRPQLLIRREGSSPGLLNSLVNLPLHILPGSRRRRRGVEASGSQPGSWGSAALMLATASNTKSSRQ